MRGKLEFIIAAILLLVATGCSDKESLDSKPEIDGKWTGSIKYTSHLTDHYEESFEGAFQMIFSGESYGYILKIRCPYLESEEKAFSASGTYSNTIAVWKDTEHEEFGYWIVELDESEIRIGKDREIRISDLTSSSFQVRFTLYDTTGNEIGYCTGELIRDNTDLDIRTYDENAKGDTPGDGNDEEEWGTVTARISAFSPMPDDFVDSCNGKNDEVKYVYDKRTEEYRVYGGQYCSDPEANDGKGVEYTATSGYNYLKINGGDAVYTVGSLSYPYTWSVYMGVTLP
jgi:hypothetical protein